MRKRGLILICCLSLYICANAVTPQFWENFTKDELLEGTLTKVSLSWDGKLFLARAYDMVFDTKEPFIFSMVRDRLGNTYLGTGHSGKVFKIDRQGTGSLYFQAKELDIFALALDSSDTLYVGTSPDGKVYKVSGPEQATEFCNPEDKYIWSLLFDDGDTLYVGTGGMGIIYKVDRSGQKTSFFEPSDSNITSLAITPDGQLLAGTSPGGLVLRIDPQGKAFTLLDSQMEEVRSMTVDRFGTIYAVATSSQAPTEAPKIDTSETTNGGGGRAISVQTVQALSAAAQASNRNTSITVPAGRQSTTSDKSSIYAIAKDGSSEILYGSKEGILYDLLVRPDDTILASTGTNGRLISIDTAKNITVLTDSAEEQITRLVGAEDAVWAAGSNQGKVYRLQAQPADSGTYISKPLDAKVISTWGKISWNFSEAQDAGIEITTRSGNTAKPDNTWSDWSSPYRSGQQIGSPTARYLQWRAIFQANSGQQDATGLLERVRIPYLQQNLAPQVVSITVLPSGIALEKPPSLTTSTLGVSAATINRNGLSLNSPRLRGQETQNLTPRRTIRPGAQSFTWNATDNNGDNLEYSIYFKGEGEKDWKLLKEDITDTFYSLYSDSLPDGSYIIKVVASDAPSNAYGKFLIGELMSKPFVISNSTPLVEITSHEINGRKVEVKFQAKIPTGRIESAEFSIDGGDWNLIFPTDGIADSTVEVFQFTTPEFSVGEHVIGLRASDINGNTGTTKLVARIP